MVTDCVVVSVYNMQLCPQQPARSWQRQRFYFTERGVAVLYLCHKPVHCTYLALSHYLIYISHMQAVGLIQNMASHMQAVGLIQNMASHMQAVGLIQNMASHMQAVGLIQEHG